MRVWLVTCIILFALVEFYQWVKGFILPLPIYVLAGAFLALASNYDKGMMFHKPQMLSQNATLVEPESLPSHERQQIASASLESKESLIEE